MRGWQSFLLGALVVAVVVLGYLYHRQSQNDVELKVKVPDVSIGKDN